jgi:hypothetical protein
LIMNDELGRKWEEAIVAYFKVLCKRRINIVLNVTSYSPVGVYRRLGGTCRLHLSSRRVQKWIFYPHDSGSTFVRNLGNLLPGYTASHLIRQ